jgi:L-fuconolactonase
MRIDAHVHFWKPECGFDNRPINDHAAYRRDFLPSVLEPDLVANDIDGALLVQTAPQTAESDWLIALAEHQPRIRGVTAWVDLDAARVDFATLRARPKVVGIRAQLRRIADPAFIARPNVVRNLAAALEARLGVTILAEPRHYAHVGDVLRQLPAGPITLNHLGLVFPDTDREAWREAMRTFATRPRLFVQLSGLPFLYGERWRGSLAQSIVDDAFAILGPERLMFASDWPMLTRFASYGDWVRYVDAYLDAHDIAGDARDAIFARNVHLANPLLENRS